MSWGLPSARHCSVAGRNTPWLRWSQPKWPSSKLSLFNHRLVPFLVASPRAATTVAERANEPPSPSHVETSPAADWSTRESQSLHAIPLRFGPLYTALAAVKNAAAVDPTNFARLQLAQSGLETETPIIRVAVFASSCNNAGVFQFVRLLLTDPLCSREDWEDYLQSAQLDISQGLLIRYGEEIRLNSGNTPVPVVTIPSRTLKKRNLEFLIALGDNVGSVDDLVAPRLASQSGLNNSSPAIKYQYPVHKSVVLGEGLDGIALYSSKLHHEDMIKSANTVHGAFLSKFDLRSRSNTQPPSKTTVSLVDVEKASDALNQFRNSVQNASTYERGWTTSGLQHVADWISAPIGSHSDQLHPAVRNLIDSSFEHTTETIERNVTRAVQDASAQSVPEEVREDLNHAVDSWAERAHTELRDELTEAFSSPSWRKLVWWKLFWRVDDVSSAVENILRRCWLTRSENEMLWLCGRLRQAKLLDQGPSPSRDLRHEQTNEESDLQRINQPPTLTEKPDQEGSSLSSILPLRIAKERSNLLQTRAPALQSLAQNLVLFSISSTALTAALSAISYVSTPDITLYEAGTVTAVGLLVSLRRQQKQWNKTRESLERDVQEKGREALDGTELSLRDSIKNNGRLRANTDITGALKDIETARKALRDVK